MNDLRTAAQQALAFIRWTQFGECRTAGWDGPPPTAAETDAALVAALAQPAPEPVAKFDERLGRPALLPGALPLADGQRLYTAPEPVAVQPLTAKEIRTVARTIKAAHGIKEES